ncbi:peptidase S8/S53 domain-containing protein [Lactarius pseudohatsudake]|nr:peptidase S8/S53 domain-containing protein [Lactarius pseudohatsudake]
MRYHWLYALSFLTATPLADFATPPAPWGDVHVKHAWSSVPANWETLGCPSAGTTIDLYIALYPHQESALIDALYEEQVAELVRPHPDTLELVTSWLAHHGVRPSSISTTHGGAWLTVSNVLVSQANEMLGASYQLYRHSEVNDTIIRTTLRRTPHRRYVDAAAALAEAEAASGKPVTMLSSRADWDEPPSLATFTVEVANGGEYDPDTPGDETSTDVQYASGMAYPTRIIFYSTGGVGKWSDSGEPIAGDAYLELIEHLLRKTDIPQTVSISYGSREYNVPHGYARGVCTLFAQLGARGVSVLFPSGDDGVGQPRHCVDESGNVRFIPVFPASCPYLTAVGGTTGYPEVAAPLSGGGFLDRFPRPVYQDVAVSAFLSRQGTQYAGLYTLKA